MAGSLKGKVWTSLFTGISTQNPGCESGYLTWVDAFRGSGTSRFVKGIRERFRSTLTPQ